MATEWDGAKAKALKILGKDAKIPDPKFLGKLQSDVNAAYGAYNKSRDDLEAKILAMQKAMSDAKLTVKQFADKLDDEDFGLDEKNKDDAKKIKDAQAIFDAWAENIYKNVNDDIRELDELDKHLVDYKKYKPTPP